MSARTQRSAGLPTRAAWWVAGLLTLVQTIAPATASPALPDGLRDGLAAASTALAAARERRFHQQLAGTPGGSTGQTRLDLGLGAADADLESLVLAIDDVVLPVAVPAPEDRVALHEAGGLLPLASPVLAEGGHRLRVDWTLRGEPARRTEFNFEVDADGGDRELRFERSQPLAGLAPILLEWQPGAARRSPFERWVESLVGDKPRSGTYRPGDADDPRWRRARHLLARGRPWLAALSLGQLETSGETDPATAALLARAAEVDRGLLAEAALAVAQRHLADGQLDAAMRALDRLPLKLAPAVRNDAVLTRARTLFALGRADRASQVLQSAEVDPVRLATASVAERLRAASIQYDLGLALIASGEAGRGQALLDRLGRSSPREPIEQALRDRANLTLASHFLGAGQGATARPIFERIPLEGPYSNLALLGLGWAALGPQGEKQSALSKGRDEVRETPKFILKAMQRRRLIDCEEYNRRALAPTELCQRLQPFEQADLSDEPANLAAEALIVWQELASREARDPTVREAWVAAGRAAAHAGRRREAGEHYDVAVTRLEAALQVNATATTRLSEAASLFKSGLPAALEPGLEAPAEAAVGLVLAQALDAAPNSTALRHLLAEIAETRWLIEAAAAGPAGSAEGEALQALSASQQALLASVAVEMLAAERRQLLIWLAAGRAGIAAIADPALPGAQPLTEDGKPP